MPSYSNTSISRLETCDDRLQALFSHIINHYDVSIVCGYRNAHDQNSAFDSGNSKVQWPNSEHNDYPSRAIDVIPYPDGWDSVEQFYFMAGYIKAKADQLGIKIRWGGDWDSDGDLDDQTFMDLGHFELVD